jgi:hypothetical protein
MGAAGGRTAALVAQDLRLMGEPAERLEALEAVISRGLKTFVEVGSALGEIREGRLYREQVHASFDAYCRERWGISKTYASRQITASRVAKELPIGTVLPANEAQARELARIADPEERAEVWGEEVREAEREGRAPTAEGAKAKAAAREATPSEEPPLPMPTEPKQSPHDGQASMLMSRALGRLSLLDPRRSRPEEAAGAMATTLAKTDDGAELVEGLRAYAKWLERAAKELDRLREADEEKRLRAYEQQTLRAVDREQGPSFYQIIVVELGGIKRHYAELHEEYRVVPRNYLRPDGLAGDEMASALAEQHPRYNIRIENDLLKYFEQMGRNGHGR